MANIDYKSPDALMRHLRDNGIWEYPKVCVNLQTDVR
jgi:hypothetical protein